MKNTIEEWRPIKNFELRYEVSSLGRVRSIYDGRNQRVRTQPKVLRPFVNRKGYLTLSLRDDGRRFPSTPIHRLVALAFVSGYMDGLHVDHINGIRDDNRAENLSWVSPEENNRRERDRYNSSGSWADWMRKPIVAYAPDGESRAFQSIRDASQELGVLYTGISNCLTGRSKSSGGYKFQYAQAKQGPPELGKTRSD